MKKIPFLMSMAALLSALSSPMMAGCSAEPAQQFEWVDSATNHRIVRLTRSGNDNKSFYFHNNPFIKTPDGKGDLMIYGGRVNDTRQFFALNLATLESVQITNHAGGARGEIVDKTHRDVIYQAGDSVFATNIDSHQTRLIAVLPAGLGASVSSVNADGTLLAGKYSEQGKAEEIHKKYPAKSDYFSRIYEAHIHHSLFTLDMATGKLNVIHEENEWTNHIQFSPTDPNLLMFCHEGHWHKVDRIWVIDVRGGAPKLMHKRSMPMEIAGHEWFAPNGKTIWFDLQQPRGERFFVCGANVADGSEVKYELTRDEWSVHYNCTRDEKLFAGDGGHEGSVAKAKDGKWIYLFRPDSNRFVSERLVNMKKHDYSLEPNVHFSPDEKWVIFRSNMSGEPQIYAVKIEKESEGK